MPIEQIQVEETAAEQVIQPLSLEEICPNWSKTMTENGGYMATRDGEFKNADGKVISIQNYNSCLVGEAHGN